jgi:hypothetical protein
MFPSAAQHFAEAAVSATAYVCDFYDEDNFIRHDGDSSAMITQRVCAATRPRQGD